MREKRYLWGNGYPFSSVLVKNLEEQKRRVENHKACMIIIDGVMGEGKTTLAVEIADYLEGKNIKFENQLSMGGVDFAKKLKKCFVRKNKVIIYDEAGDFNRRGALSRLNQVMNRVFETYRTLNIIVILCLPSFSVLDNQLLLKGVPRLLIHCYGRNEHNGKFKLYSLFRMSYVLHHMSYMVIKQKAYNKVSPNGFGVFLDLPPERSKELDLFSCKGKVDILDHGEIISQGLISYTDIAPRVQRSVVWVKNIINLLDIKHKKILDRKKYFSPEVVDVLCDHIETYRQKGE